ncbi:MAG: type II toxin-antitoxin system Phd/YefM family antitoxin [Bifidobacteriaceae bacterium]|jgi:antitoxin (DNA-binding transcriptional repressor) of toxin-antitoxin stability system|nr:type II toxin-antitoxin system Phd/YefM family antitoxin [Bifidobacteriaceae bacterium]
MKTISVGDLRQNPTAALAAVERGETYLVVKYRQPVAQLVPYGGRGPSPDKIAQFGESWRRQHADQLGGFTPDWLEAQRTALAADDPWER